MWHKVTLLLEGPEMTESPSTFRDFRLNVTSQTETSNLLFPVILLLMEMLLIQVLTGENIGAFILHQTKQGMAIPGFFRKGKDVAMS